MIKKKSFTYPGESIDVTWDGSLCIHIAECGRAEGDLFVTGRKPWCIPDAYSKEDVVDVCERCPSGALSYIDKSGGTGNTPLENTIMVSYNGPLFISGELQFEGLSDDYPAEHHRVALCRCGQSKNKPFCDNSHIEAGFSDFGAVAKNGPETSASGETLNIRLRPDGPLKITGNMKIIASSGRTAWQGEETALCRCGASKNKPYCDGSHRNINFSSE